MTKFFAIGAALAAAASWARSLGTLARFAGWLDTFAPFGPVLGTAANALTSALWTLLRVLFAGLAVCVANPATWAVLIVTFVGGKYEEPLRQWWSPRHIEMPAADRPSKKAKPSRAAKTAPAERKAPATHWLPISIF